MSIKEILKKIDEMIFECEENDESEKYEVLTELKEWIIEDQQ